MFPNSVNKSQVQKKAAKSPEVLLLRWKSKESEVGVEGGGKGTQPRIGR